ncbi:protein-export membrane protein SecF [Candidatus Roizmanbacteria bacterium RIFCSPHIGHO2_02_FULL_37_13b]|uniref:Protein-export membrane protein SecF n=1 Tax=Candidatus Roizmanbacteria bacterium RIFCSPLOWO2_02_FULL_36_11 TaxID=1802071 RepID=A0A1F7JHL4_9BACT|nr:MAG: protein-export membrane protein SecF [Candidatus Roizmanbacteria bacterium RIFCSPHIGHO2_02_FULL_37_13b]OGK55101.1 MAG: protein-export membrane protein SecF [Candidatus Roizmanbacteria bacterium RIFCSPLOWO2_02_FULL_36_11]
MINFLKYKWVYFLISTIVIVTGLFSIVFYGFNVSIDFAGGSNIEYQFNKNINKKDIETILKNNKVKIYTTTISNKGSLHLRAASIDEKKEKQIRDEMEKKMNLKIQLLRFETVGPTLGKETIIKTMTASLIAGVGILLYLTFAFKNLKYGFAAILAALHDLLVLFGSYSIISHFFGAELDLLFVTAILTTMSFSVHDTIVVFDKIREHRKKEWKTDFSTIANRALTETMVRSLNNSLTIILMLVALTLVGGEVIRFFVIMLLIGTITGTYSSPFVATPLLEFMVKRER